MSIIYGIVIVEKQILTPALAFLVLHIFHQISSDIRFIPDLYKVPMNAWSSLHRIVNFLNMEESHKEKFIEQRVAEKGELTGNWLLLNYSHLLFSLAQKRQLLLV
jgi:hypothetical protein